jgi:hypothetical protein
VEPAPILPSNVDKPPQPEPAAPGESVAASAAPSASVVEQPTGADGNADWLPYVLVVGLVAGMLAAVIAARRGSGASA